MDMNLSKLQETVKNWEVWCAAIHGGHLATEQQQTHIFTGARDKYLGVINTLMEFKATRLDKMEMTRDPWWLRR